MAPFLKPNLLLFIACTLIAGGCASVDPASDIDDAADHVAQRIDARPPWNDQPWIDPATAAWSADEPLAADRAVRIALLDNPAFRAELTHIASARADLAQQYLLPNPIINFSYGFVTDGGGGSPLTLGMTNQLAWLLTRDRAIGQAEAALEQRVLAASDEAIRLAAQVNALYAEVVVDNRAAQLHDEIVLLSEQSDRIMNAAWDAGEASRLDLNRVRLDLDRARVARDDHRARQRRTRLTLLNALGRPQLDPDKLAVIDALPVSIDDAASLTERDATRLAHRQRLDVATARAAVDVAAERLGVAENGVFRNIRAGLAYQENFNERRGIFPSLLVEIPIFDDSRAHIAADRAILERSVLQAAAIIDEAHTEARLAMTNVVRQRDAARQYEEGIVRTARRNLELAQAELAAGTIDVSAALDAQRQFNRISLEYLERTRQIALAAIELQRSVGGTLEELPNLVEEEEHHDD